MDSLTLWIGIVIGMAVFGAIPWSVVGYRRRMGAEAAHFHPSIAIELLWSTVPLLIVVFMAIPAIDPALAAADAQVATIAADRYSASSD